MKNLQKGFVVPLLLAIIAVLVIGGGVYIYNTKKLETPILPVSTEVQTTNQVKQTNDKTSTTSFNKYPVITGISGPRELNLNQLGKWTVDAYSPNDKEEGSTLTYSVKWGDIVPAVKIGNAFDTTDVQTSTFTHAYSDFGKYTQIFTAKDSTGAQTTKSIEVRVMNTTSAGVDAGSTYTYTNHGFSIKLPGVFIPKEEESEGGPVTMISLPVGGLAYVKDASFWEKYNIPNYTYVKDQKIGNTTFKIYTTPEGKLYWFKQGNVGYEFSLFKFGISNDIARLESLLETFKFVGWPQS